MLKTERLNNWPKASQPVNRRTSTPTSGSSAWVRSRHSVTDQNDRQSLLPFTQCSQHVFYSSPHIYSDLPSACIFKLNETTIILLRPGAVPGILWVCNQYLLMEKIERRRKGCLVWSLKNTVTQYILLNSKKKKKAVSLVLDLKYQGCNPNSAIYWLNNSHINHFTLSLSFHIL